MKLAKTVIVSGLLFSSVLGSVNVGSITAMAADNAQTSARTLGPANLPKPGDTAKPITKKVINIKYVDRYGVEEKRTQFVEKSQKTIEVDSNAKEVSLSNITLPEWYVFLDSGSVKIDSNNTVTIKVKKNKVDTTGITELTPPEIITPDEQEQQSHEPQLTAPDIVTVGNPDDNKPAPSTTKLVQLKFIDKNTQKTLDKAKTIKVPNAEKSTVITEDMLPEGYQFEFGAKQATLRINSSKDGQNVIYIAVVKKSTNVATQKNVTVKFVDSKTNKVVTSGVQTFSVDSTAKSITIKSKDVPKGYQLIDGKSTITLDIKSDGSAQVKVESTKIVTPTNNNVQIQFIDKATGKAVINSSKTVQVSNSTKNVIIKKDMLPTGYQLESDMPQITLSINNEDGKNTVYVRVVKIGSEVVTKKNVTVKFVNAKTGKSIPSGIQIFQVNKEDKTITIDGKNLPSGYKLANGKNEIKLDINKDGSVQVKVESTKAVSTPAPAPSKPNKPSKPATKPSKRPSNARYTIQRVRITFVDQNSKDLVGYKQVTGKNSFSTKIEAPRNYAFVNEKNATIKFDKSGNKEILVFVKLMTAAPVKHVGVVTTNGGSYKRLYTLEGKMITNRALGTNSQWYTDQYAIVKGEKMYRVATNEWVRASDVK